MALYTIACVLFAGGKSSRMGTDKALLPFARKSSLAEYQYERLKAIFERVYLSAKEAKLFDHFDVEVIEDEIAKEVYAPTAGFVNLFRHLRKDNMVFVMSIDTPFVDQSIINTCIEAIAKNDYDAVIVRTPGGIHPLCGIYSRSMEEAFLKMLREGEHKLSRLLEKSKVHYIDINDEEALLNMNTPKDYEKALKILKEKD